MILFFVIMFILLAIVCYFWVVALDNCKDVDRDKIEFP